MLITMGSISLCWKLMGFLILLNMMEKNLL
nr:MAG TPA: hypothetical protein [Bacteriophage sp.]